MRKSSCTCRRTQFARSLQQQLPNGNCKGESMIWPGEWCISKIKVKLLCGKDTVPVSLISSLAWKRNTASLGRRDCVLTLLKTGESQGHRDCVLTFANGLLTISNFRRFDYCLRVA